MPNTCRNCFTNYCNKLQSSTVTYIWVGWLKCCVLFFWCHCSDAPLIRKRLKTCPHCSVSSFYNRKVGVLEWKVDIYFSDKDYENAIKYYTDALELNPSNAIYYSNRSLAYLRTECYGYALADATKALEIDKNYIKGYYRRATSNMALGKFKAALKDYETVSDVASF